ncbi:hypothetical protein ABZ707_06480 [Streptomyces sp. NPDC006923]|uniref:hypothetical protein n=1 Tax=Streptomyces sp. NPDC006923 TaxID=3155355 RepID=UPI0033DBBA64
MLDSACIAGTVGHGSITRGSDAGSAGQMAAGLREFFWRDFKRRHPPWGMATFAWTGSRMGELCHYHAYVMF